MADRPTAIELRGVSKSFRIPEYRADRLKERFLHPMQSGRYREAKVIDDVSIDIGRGEFFGILGVNGSGKSTLLKLMASIYHADRGTIRIAGRLAPFIELGVGFNNELNAYDNVLLNGVMMGLTPQEARRRFDPVIEFAGLREYAGLKLKNYSSGMRLRLAFSVMVQVDADVLLIDEVLAVGDAAFRERCEDVLLDLRRQGKTIAFVTHSMPDVERYCHRAMVLHEGKIHALGDPGDVARSYMELNFQRREEWLRAKRPRGEERRDGAEPEAARIADMWIEDDHGRRRSSVEQGEDITLRATIEVDEPIALPMLALELTHISGTRVFGAPLRPIAESEGAIAPGSTVRMEATIENRLVPGPYLLQCGVFSGNVPSGEEPLAASRGESLEVTVSGTRRRGAGLVVLDHDVRFEQDVTVEAPAR